MGAFPVPWEILGAASSLIEGSWGVLDGFELAERRSGSRRWGQTCIKTVLEAFGMCFGCVFGLLGKSWALLEALLQDLGRLRWI